MKEGDTYLVPVRGGDVLECTVGEPCPDASWTDLFLGWATGAALVLAVIFVLFGIPWLLNRACGIPFWVSWNAAWLRDEWRRARGE